MAIALTTQANNNGFYTAYLPVNFVATETTNNPAYLTFELKTSAGASIPNVPKYKAPNINNEYFFDASNYLKSVFTIINGEGFDTTSIEELESIYGKFEVVVSDTINALSPLTSNEFYAFAFIDSLRFDNYETANYGISRKGLLYGSAIKDTNPNTFAKKLIGIYDHVSLFATKALVIDTYQVDGPNNSSTIFETGTLDLSTYYNKLVSVPLNQTFVIAEFVKSGGGTLSAYKGFRIRESGTPINTCIYYHVNNLCNTSEYIFINRYGCKENIIFQSYETESYQTKSDEFMSGKFDHKTFNEFFDTSANTIKINQESQSEYEVRGQYFSNDHKEELKDFIKSPIHLLLIPSENDDLKIINVYDGSFRLLNESRVVKFSFKYRNSQKELSFI